MPSARAPSTSPAKAPSLRSSPVAELVELRNQVEDAIDARDANAVVRLLKESPLGAELMRTGLGGTSAIRGAEGFADYCMRQGGQVALLEAVVTAGVAGMTVAASLSSVSRRSYCDPSSPYAVISPYEAMMLWPEAVAMVVRLDAARCAGEIKRSTFSGATPHLRCLLHLLRSALSVGPNRADDFAASMDVLIAADAPIGREDWTTPAMTAFLRRPVRLQPGETPLQQAYITDLLRRYVEAGHIDLNAPVDDIWGLSDAAQSPLTSAIVNHDVPLLTALIQLGCRTDGFEYKGMTVDCLGFATEALQPDGAEVAAAVREALMARTLAESHPTESVAAPPAPPRKQLRL